MYRAGLPFWKVVARLGGVIQFRIVVEQDKDAGVYIASSPDLKGLVVEAETLDELKRETEDCIDMLMRAHLNGHALRTSATIKFQELLPV